MGAILKETVESPKEPQEPSPPKLYKQNNMYSIAERVQMGESGKWYIYCLEEDMFYVYEDGYWHVIFEIELLANICKAFPFINTNTIATKKQIIEHLKVLCQKHLTIFNKENYVNFREGLFDPVHEQLIDHHPDHFSTIRIGYSYKWNTGCSLWLKTLGEIFESSQEKIDILQEFCGYCLTRETNREKALLLLGESRTGKSTILQTIRYLVGEKNCSSVPLKFISNPQYTPMLINKMINIDPDVSGKATDFEAEFKTITSGEPMSCNQKFVPTFEFFPFCKLIMAANEFPRITDHSSAFYKRLILLPCDRVFEDGEQDINLKKNLLNELPGIFNWAVEGLGRLNKRGKFNHEQFMADAIQELREESNPVELFFKEHIEINMEKEVEKGPLYEKYKEWSKLNQQFVLSAAKFSYAVYRKYAKTTFKDTKSKMTNKRVWKNLEYVGFKIEEDREAEEKKKQDRLTWTE